MNPILKSVGAVLAGVATGIVLSIGTDMGLYAAGLFPPPGAPMPDPLLALATVYRTVYGVAGAYLTARLAPNRPLEHALVLGVLGLAANVAGLVATWGRGPAYGHEWYPILLTALAIPTAWAGGWLRVARVAARA